MSVATPATEGHSSPEPSSESTPLLPHHSRETNSPVQTKRTRSTYGFVFGFLTILILIICNVQSTLPAPLSDAEAEALDDFAGLHCYNEYLSRFNLPHSGNQRGNVIIKDWIVSIVNEFAAEARKNGIHVDLDTNDNTTVVLKRNKYSQDGYWFMESNNVMIRLKGQSGSTNNALLVNAHYDSVSTSHGVTDNGMGTAIAIELLRYFVRHPPAKTMIFLFNDLEENGLVGAETFVRHPWFSTVELFVNLEGTGAGGRALLFRGSSLDAVKSLSKSTAHLLHGSPLGNDMLQAHILRSDTDYTIFTANGIPGLDIAFYTPRSHYHTQRDDLAHTTASSLQHMGQMALGSVRSIASHPQVAKGEPQLETFVFYDILGRVLLVYSFDTCQTLNILALITVLLGSCSWMMSISLKTSNPKEDLLRKLTTLGHGFLATVTAALAMYGCMIVSAYIMSKLNPLASYGNGFIVAFLLFTASMLGLVLSQHLLVKICPSIWQSLTDVNTTLYGLTAFWWILLTVAAYLCSQKVAGVYFAVYFLVSSALACVLSLISTHLPDKLRPWRYELVMVVQMMAPVVLMTEICLLAIKSLRHTTADGTPEMSVYHIMIIPILLISLQLLPWVHHASTEKLKPIVVATSSFVIFIIVCLLLSPFNSSESPNRIVFNQEYNSSAPLSTVTLVTGPTKFEATLRRSMTSSEVDSVFCSPLPSQTKCVYQTNQIPVYGNLSKEIKVHVDRHCDGSVCKVNVTAVVQHSSICQLGFDRSYNMKTTANGYNVSQDKDMVGGLLTYSRTIRKPMVWQLEYTQDLKPITARVSCLYDDWTNSEIPAFTTLRSRLPEWSLLTIRGSVGLALVNFDSFNI